MGAIEKDEQGKCEKPPMPTVSSKKDQLDLPAQTSKKRVMGVELAPLNIPWNRRMETLSIVQFMLTFFVGGLAGTFTIFYMTFCTRFYWLSLLYIVWYIYDYKTPHKGGRRIQWIRRWKRWIHFSNYFPVRLVKTTELDPSKNYLFASHPHGVLCIGSFSSFATEGTNFSQLFPGIQSHLLVLQVNFKFPLYREYAMAFGTCPASRASMNYLLSRPEGGHAAVIIPGGASESLDAHPSQECVLHLSRRKGFIRLALQNGSPLVPVFCFGENDVFSQVPNAEGSRLRKIQNYLQKILSFAPIIILGRGIFQYTFGVLPQRRKVTVVVGSPLTFDKVQEPSQKEIDNLHKKYIEQLTQLFETHKHKYGNGDCYLKIV